MNFGIKDITFIAVVVIGLGIVVNRAADLNVPILNSIDETVFGDGSSEPFEEEDPYYPESGGSYSEGSSSVSDQCHKARTSAGDARVQLRGKMEKAKEEQDLDEVAKLEERLDSVDNMMNEACNED